MEFVLPNVSTLRSETAVEIVNALMVTIKALIHFVLPSHALLEPSGMPQEKTVFLSAGHWKFLSMGNVCARKGSEMTTDMETAPLNVHRCK